MTHSKMQEIIAECVFSFPSSSLLSLMAIHAFTWQGFPTPGILTVGPYKILDHWLGPYCMCSSCLSLCLRKPGTWSLTTLQWGYAGANMPDAATATWSIWWHCIANVRQASHGIHPKRESSNARATQRCEQPEPGLPHMGSTAWLGVSSPPTGGCRREQGWALGLLLTLASRNTK